MPGPYRSILNEHRKEIADLRKTHPPTPYSQIAKILFDKYKIKIRASSIWSFVKARSIEGERKLKYVIAEEGTPASDQPAGEVNAKKETPTNDAQRAAIESGRARVKQTSEPRPKTEWDDFEPDDTKPLGHS